MGVTPNLIHQVKIQIAKLKDKGSIAYDDIFNEPEEKDSALYDLDNLIDIEAQVKFFTGGRLEAKQNGYDENSNGYILAHRKDVTNLNIEKSDQIVSIDGAAVEYYITENRPTTFYISGFYFFRLVFRTRTKGII